MLVDITEDSYGVILDIRYATSNNVTGKPIYDAPHCKLHKDAAEKLAKAVSLAKELDLTLKIFDAWRPASGQQALWDFCPDDTFITPPTKGSPHTRGVAVDLTLVDSDGNELEMGTEFDDFTPRAFHADIEISKTAQQNRFTLLGIMSAAGWDFYKNEWWHYQLFNARAEYPLIESA